MTMMIMILSLLLLILLMQSTNSKIFQLPSIFEGLYEGQPTYSVLGPWLAKSYIFSISKSSKGDYLMDVNLRYDSTEIEGYQRFYIEGNGDNAGNMNYCGSLSNYSNGIEQTSHLYKSFPSEYDNSVTFCLDTDRGTGWEQGLPFPIGCSMCQCSNWTISYNSNKEMLISQHNSAGSQHLYVELKKIGDAPVINDNDIPSPGNFSCDFNGRDSVPVERGSSNCPFYSTFRKLLNPHKSTATATTAATTTSTKSAVGKYSHCYFLNKHVGFQLSWTLDMVQSRIKIQLSAPATFGNSTWVAIGFRPLSRDFSPKVSLIETGRHLNFGMEGADIVAGSINKGIRLLYAKDFVGEPVASSDFEIYDSIVYDGTENGTDRVVLEFSRDFIGGHLFKNYGINASILSNTNDIIWAVGQDDSKSKESSCSYHENSRGLRLIDFENPELALLNEWKC